MILGKSKVNELSRWMLYGGVVSGLLCLVGLFISKEQFFVAYLQGYSLWIGVTLGCIGLLLLHNLVGGRWGEGVSEILHAGSRTLPVMTLLFLPVILGASEIYPWLKPIGMENEIVKKKLAYLNLPFFGLRAVLFFAVWTLLSAVARRENGADRKRFSAPGMILFVLTVSFAAVDWLMSLEPEWVSSLYGAIFLVGALVSTLGVTLVLLKVFPLPLEGKAEAGLLHDLGKLLLMAVMLWAYLSFSQYLIIWSGNLAEELPWYRHRMRGGWQFVGLGLILGHFLVPFLLLLSRRVKQQLSWLAAIAAGLLVMRWGESVWLVMPAFSPGKLHLPWLSLVTPLAIGGAWGTLFLHYFKKSPTNVTPKGEGRG